MKEIQIQLAEQEDDSVLSQLRLCFFLLKRVMETLMIVVAEKFFEIVIDCNSDCQIPAKYLLRLCFVVVVLQEKDPVNFLEVGN